MSLQYKSVEDLNKTIWYRFVKVVYIAMFIFVYLISIAIAISSLGSVLVKHGGYHDIVTNYYLYIIGAIFIIPLIFWLFVGVFNYIIIGKFILPKIKKRK